MTDRKQLFRSADAPIAGVCGGIAEYLDISPTLVRMLAVVLLVFGAGSPILVYLVLVLVLPREPTDYSTYVDVDPVQAVPQPKQGRPVPPEGVPVYDIPSPPQAEQGQSTPGAAYSAAYCTTRDATVCQPEQPRGRRYRGLVYLGAFLILIGFGNLMSRVDPLVHWWSYLPLVIVFIGILHMSTRSPRKVRWEPVRLFDGLIMVAAGCIFLGQSIGFLDTGVWRYIFSLWPLFLVAAGIAVVSAGFRSSAGRCFAAFLVTCTLVLGCAGYLVGYRYLTQVYPEASYLLDGAQSDGVNDAIVLSTDDASYPASEVVAVSYPVVDGEEG